MSPPRAGVAVAHPVPAGAPARHPDRLHRFFEATVARTPRAVALQDGGLELTYAELDARANQLARHLAGLGAGPGRRVGILLHRTWRTYAVLLAIGKTGAAFVPIDPAAPADRVGYIRDDAGLDLLVTTSDLAGELPTPGLVLLDTCVDAVAALPRHPLAPVAPDPDPAPLAYIIYTSGSSGRPKGVAIAHPSICNFVHVITRVYDVRSHDRAYQGMTISFDFSIEEIWPTFAAGATLVVGPTDSRRIGAELGDFLAGTGVTVLCCVPTLLATIPRELPALRTLLVGGEACPAGLVERWARPGRRMLNTYGPTETTVTCTWGELHPGKPVTIGRPVPTYSAVILDDTLREVPRGEVGELCIGGPGVGIGYVNLPEKTADRFVRHPAAPANGDGRLYRTGDLARFDEHGEIVYLGRADDEVKIRGHRVDLGEIETVALEHADVESAVAAVARTDDGTGEELTVYVVPAAGPGGPVDRAALHELLRTRLPEYMVPGYLEVLDALPMMPSGKVDRPKLPAPSGPRIVVTHGPHVEPSTELETGVRAVLAEVLALDAGQVSVTADFFDELGGHSLLAARLVTLLRERGVGRSPAVRDLYEHPTVRGLAAALDPDAAGDGGDGSVPPPPRPEPLRHSRRRYSAAGTAQGAALFVLMLVMTLPAAGVYAWHGGRVAPDVLAQLALGATAIFLLQRWLLAPLAVRALTARVAPGRYPMWGRVHLRLWAADLLLSMSPLPVLSGGPLAPAYLRMLGATVGRDVHLGTSVLSMPALLRIDDGATVGYGAALRPWTLADGWVTVAPIAVGEGAHVGASAVVEPGAVVGADAVVGEQSALAADQVVPPAEHWAGSPAVPDAADAAVAELTERGPAPSWTRPQRAAALAGIVALELVSLLALVPAVLLVWSSLLLFGDGPALLVAALVGPVFVVTVCVLVAVGRWAVAPRTGPGVFPARSALGLRKWFGDKLLEMSLTYTNSLYSTLYTVGWLRLLGARIGRGAEVSTASHIDPEMLTISQGSFVADMASVGSATFHNGWMVRRPTLVGRRAFVGNAAVVPAGSTLGDESLIGVATVPPASGVPHDTTWLGSPAMHLPVRQDSGDHPESLTFTPSRRRVAERLGIEFLRATLPASAISVSIYLFLQGLSGVARTGAAWQVVLAAPVLALASALALVLLVAAVKWLVVGTYRPRTEPLWSRFVRRSEFVTGLYEASAVPGLLSMLSGTPLLPPMLRLLGARIGRRTCVSTTYLTEYDLVEIGDDAVVGRDVSLQTHLFEDRVMKMSTVSVADGASVGDRAIVLYDAVVGAGARLDPLSLVMKGEHLPPGSRYRGITARAVPDAAPADAAPVVPPAVLPAVQPAAAPETVAGTVRVAAVDPERTMVLTRLQGTDDPGRTLRMRSVLAGRQAPRRGSTGRHRAGAAGSAGAPGPGPPAPGTTAVPPPGRAARPVRGTATPPRAPTMAPARSSVRATGSDHRSRYRRTRPGPRGAVRGTHRTDPPRRAAPAGTGDGTAPVPQPRDHRSARSGPGPR
ncbi:Pls/PosA family non-ribosomal peptide synthetase [Pseudonocardia alni]|uniref:Pls/PosA family non-ribosomal peptide synthetase n=1 Tax=Pseudonocardia alni TaxID=33907 RepID=UPI00279BAC3F|nr:amino acid adenylation domain-containing protein [Pseudonocardia alni]